MKNFEIRLNLMKRFVIAIILTIFVFTIGCTNSNPDPNWGGEFEVVASDETDSLSVILNDSIK